MHYCILMHIGGIQTNGIDDLICKAEIETQTRGQMYGYQRGMGGGGKNWEIGIDTYTLLILCRKQIINENILHRSGNST